MEKQERKNKKILTENRLVTVNRRECSFEGLAASLETGEDGVHNLINENKNQILQPKVSITKKDVAEITELAQLKQAIAALERRMPHLEGKAAYINKCNIIDLRKDQYLIKDQFYKPVVCKTLIHTKFPLTYEDTSSVNEEGRVIPDGVTLTSAAVCSFILCNYSKLKGDSEDRIHSDLWALMKDFDALCEKTLAEHPVYERIVLYKIDGIKNVDIAEKIQLEFGIKHTPEYISCLWRNKIPKMIASVAEDEWLDWYFLNVEKGIYKKCGRCGQIKLANNKYFSKNKTSKDHWYSICKECRNKKTKERKNKNG